MVMRRRVFACSVIACFFAVKSGTLAQTLLGATSTQQLSASQAQAASPAPAAPAPQVNSAEIMKRANESVGVNIPAKLTSWQKELDQIEEGLRRPNLRYNELNGYRDQLLALRADAEQFWNKLEGPLASVEAQVQKLPAVPAAGQPPELEPAALLRAELNYHLGVLSSARNSLDGTHSRINQLINTIQDIRRKNFTNNLFQPIPGIFSAQTWESVPEFAAIAVNRVRGAIEDWWRGIHDQEGIEFLGATALILWLALSFIGWRSIRKLRRWNGAGEPPFWRRASSAAAIIVLKSMPIVIPLVFLYNAVAEAHPMPENVGWLFYSFARSVIIIVVVNALITTVLAPRSPEWRLIPASNSSAKRISHLVLLLALLYGATTFVYAATRIVQAPFSLTLALTLPANLLVAACVIAILRTPLQEKRSEGLPSVSWLKALRLPFLFIAIAIIATALTGYLALSRFIAQQLIVTGSILALVYLLLLWVDGLAESMTDETSAAGSWLKTAGGLDQSQRGRLAVPIALLLKFVVLVSSVPLILLQWAYPWSDIIELYRQLFFGFHIGNTQVSLAAIFAAIIVFVLGYFAAKLFQQWLDAQVLKPAGLSLGLRDSIRTGVGYIGIFAAALIALSYAGFNLSNLAIVAGAFSVGIGFGLQSVVSNFVSGLILLAERPIKVGDLVVVGDEEGYVRKISVRSTEIETFDRANVLIPNSYFITEKVKNWTLRNNSGRVTISVGVAYGCDPRAVKAILLKVAQDNLNVMTTPEPFVDFEEFGADTLNFKLYAFVHDLNKRISTRTDLRIAILEAFNAAGIVIPARQTDITVRDIDWLRDAVKHYMASTYNGHTVGNRSEAAAPVVAQSE
jgi:potassium-dependent mechanosensitive channel